jgi:large repetitive protein
VRIGEMRSAATVLDAGTIAILTPAHAAGTVDVIVTNPGGLEARLAGGYAYVRLQRRLARPCRSRLRDGHALHHSE